MLAATLVLASVAQLSAAPLASTYDEAACSAQDEGATDSLARTDASLINDAADLQSLDCAPPPVAPAVLDCNDERMSYFVAEMIGSCDMPRPTIVGPPTVKAPAPARVCDGLRCAHDSGPLCTPARTTDDSQPIAQNAIALQTHFAIVPFAIEYPSILLRDFAKRLERPPRL